MRIFSLLKRSLPTALSLLTLQVSGPSWIILLLVRSRFCGREADSMTSDASALMRRTGRRGAHLELCCDGIGQPLQRRQVQPALVLAELMPVLCLSDDLVNDLQYPTATGLCSLKQLQVRRRRCTQILY